MTVPVVVAPTTVAATLQLQTANPKELASSAVATVLLKFQTAHAGYGLFHGLKIARQLSIFTPVYPPVPPFRVLLNKIEKKMTIPVDGHFLFWQVAPKKISFNLMEIA